MQTSVREYVAGSMDARYPISSFAVDVMDEHSSKIPLQLTFALPLVRKTPLLHKADETATCTAQRENMARFLIWRLCRIVAILWDLATVS